jgi:DNA invertase Pin-like site-specific DNA recombinase
MNTPSSRGQTVAYRRVSTTDQNLDRQDFAGYQVDRVFEDKASGSSTDRPALKDCMAHLREGDVLLVHSIDRMARSLKDLLQTIESLNGKGVTIRFLKENLSFPPDGGDEMAKLQMSILGAVAAWELSMLKSRQAEGIQKAKLAGKYRGRKAKLDAAGIAEVNALLATGISKAEVARRMGVSRQTLYATLDASRVADAKE